MCYSRLYGTCKRGEGGPTRQVGDAEFNVERIILSHQGNLGIGFPWSVSLVSDHLHTALTHRKLASIPRTRNRAAGRSVIHGCRPHPISRPHKSRRAHLVLAAIVCSSPSTSCQGGEAKDRLNGRHVLHKGQTKGHKTGRKLDGKIMRYSGQNILYLASNGGAARRTRPYYTNATVLQPSLVLGHWSAVTAKAEWTEQHAHTYTHAHASSEGEPNHMHLSRQPIPPTITSSEPTPVTGGEIETSKGWPMQSRCGD